jgi:hypothetical protein
MRACGFQPTPTNAIWGKEVSKEERQEEMRRSREEIKVPVAQHMMR